MQLGFNTFNLFARQSGISSPTISVQVERRKKGDANGDGIVDDFDLAAIAVHWGEVWCEGDFDGNEVIDDFDLTTLATYWEI